MRAEGKELLYQGWLTKSPPERKTGWKIFKSKWRRRWFVLHESPDLSATPGTNAILSYYKNETLKDYLGYIDLRCCEEVISELDSNVYDHLFALRTKHRRKDRTYYLASATVEDMTKWVDCLCQALGLRENNDKYEPAAQPINVSQPPSLQSSPQRALPPDPQRPTPRQHIEIPPPVQPIHRDGEPDRPPSREGYIPLDECFSGKPEPPPPRQNTGTLTKAGLSELSAVPPPYKANQAAMVTAPVPPAKMGPREIDATYGQTYDSPKPLNNITCMADIGGSDEDVYKMPRPTAGLSVVDDDDVYKVPRSQGVHQSSSVDENMYKVPPVWGGGGHKPVTPDVEYDIPPTHSAKRVSPDRTNRHSGSSGGTQTDDSGIHSEVYDIPRKNDTSVDMVSNKLHASHIRDTITQDEEYDYPPPRPEQSNRVTRQYLDNVPPPPRPPRPGELNVNQPDNRYINLHKNSVRTRLDSNPSDRRPHKAPVSPPEETYDFPPMRGDIVVPANNKSENVAKMLDATPPPATACTVVRHKYANAPSGFVPAPQGNNTSGEGYLPMSKTSPTSRFSSHPGLPAADDSLYLPMGNVPVSIAHTLPRQSAPRADKTDSIYTDMSSQQSVYVSPPHSHPAPKTQNNAPAFDFGRSAIQAAQADEMNHYAPRFTPRSRSFKRDIAISDNPPLPVKRSDNVDSSSDDETDDNMSDTRSNSPGRSIDNLTKINDKSLHLKINCQKLVPEIPMKKGKNMMKVTPPPAKKCSTDTIEYTDLDLDTTGSDPEKSPVFHRGNAGNQSPTDYKEIDFVRTKALDQTKKELENKRKSSEKSMDE